MKQLQGMIDPVANLWLRMKQWSSPSLVGPLFSFSKYRLNGFLHKYIVMISIPYLSSVFPRKSTGQARLRLSKLVSHRIINRMVSRIPHSQSSWLHWHDLLIQLLHFLRLSLILGQNMLVYRNRITLDSQKWFRVELLPPTLPTLHLYWIWASL